MNVNGNLCDVELLKLFRLKVCSSVCLALSYARICQTTAIAAAAAHTAVVFLISCWICDHPCLYNGRVPHGSAVSVPGSALTTLFCSHHLAIHTVQLYTRVLYSTRCWCEV